MSTEMDSARDDLAYMRALVNDGGRLQKSAGAIFFWAGLLYGGQCLGHFLTATGLVQLPAIGHLLLGFAPTFVFIVVICVLSWKWRKDRPSGAASRALNAVFQGLGVANLVMIVVFAYGAHIAQSFTIWLYHPVVASAFQGVAWYVAWVIRRQVWLLVVSVGWFGATLACGLLIDQPALFLAVLSVTLLLCMALPGYVMMRLGRARG